MTGALWRGGRRMLGMAKRRAGLQPLHLIVEKDETGTFVAHVEELPGCVSQGVTYQEALDNLFEALQGYLTVQLRRLNQRALEQSVLPGAELRKREIELALV